MSELIYNVMKMWRDELDQANIIDLKDPEPLHIDRPLSREEAMSRESHIQMTRGEDYTWPIRFRKYNYEDNRFEPYDLTGHDIAFNVYRANRTIAMTIHVVKDGKHLEIDYNLSVSNEQNDEYSKLQSDEDKGKFLQGIINSSQETQEEIMRLLVNAVKNSEKQ